MGSLLHGKRQAGASSSLPVFAPEGRSLEVRHTVHDTRRSPRPETPSPCELGTLFQTDGKTGLPRARLRLALLLLGRISSEEIACPIRRTFLLYRSGATASSISVSQLESLYRIVHLEGQAAQHLANQLFGVAFQCSSFKKPTRRHTNRQLQASIHVELLDVSWRIVERDWNHLPQSQTHQTVTPASALIPIAKKNAVYRQLYPQSRASKASL